ncbi:MAG: FtsH protease activity modulator HflK [Rhodobacteraceae bacterium]|jgi:membrane protease subunit HflK|uniref:FtsH protease activity modulator HflK n=1 Tax=Albidovulum sp. TaxID=1872424 RepID=UPI001D9693B0|nr:FtsH protease activity modulator HflK [uncultured Defluviimonas sp.]MCB2125854.1 FtsH protease activity modulator HflK [Paracoccaceae bacterium]MCC0070056.1 FtsH protease activity modulator HflK [Paracoccaceae bacterium]
MAGSGGPWGGGGSDGDDDKDRPGGRGGRRPGEGPQLPDVEEIVRKGADQLRVLMGGRGGGPRGPAGGGGRGQGPQITRGTLGLGALAAVGLWAFASFYTVRPEEQSVELFLGKFSSIGQPGLNFAPWPIVTANVVAVTPERTEDIGVGRGGSDSGLMLTGDENIVDIDFQVVWNISDPTKYLFNLRDPELTINAVAEASMREIIAQSLLAPILNRDRGAIAERLKDLIQTTLDSYDSGLNVVRVNFDRADPPREVIEAFKNVQSAEQQRDRLQKEADAYANTVLAGARGQAAQLLEEAEAYRAQVVNQAQGEASRFTSVLVEYQKAPEVTRKRLYLETLESVLGQVDKVILDERAGQGVVPYLPLNELGRKPATGGSN